jgi:hypothetical protein
MKKLSISFKGFLYALGVVIYIAGVATLMQNGSKLFGEQDNALTPIAVLLLFVVSALITSTLVLGRPIYLYFEGEKKEAVKLFFLTGTWLTAIAVLFFMILIIVK